ncbi:MAG: DMT family transporter [Burkholderiaceae bacterium]
MSPRQRRRTRKLNLAGARLQRWGETLNPVTRAMLWSMGAGLSFSVLNAIMRQMTTELDPMQTQFLRYFFGLVAMLPIMLRRGLSKYRPNSVRGQVWRGIVHTLGLVLWFTALPHLSLAYMTAIGFTTPIFIMLGAAWFFGEKMVLARWLAAIAGFAGVLIVVWPKLAAGDLLFAIIMLASAPVFASSFLLTKALTRRDSPSVIVAWQAIMITLFSLPLAVPFWHWPEPAQWGLFAIGGVLGSLGHYCLTRSFVNADISATQPVRFLDLIWAALLGYVVFADVPAITTLIGGCVILAATVWIARREAIQRRPAQD